MITKTKKILLTILGIPTVMAAGVVADDRIIESVELKAIDKKMHDIERAAYSWALLVYSKREMDLKDLEQMARFPPFKKGQFLTEKGRAFSKGVHDAVHWVMVNVKNA